MAFSNTKGSAAWGNHPRYGEFEIVGAREGKPRLLGEGSFGKTFEAVRRDTIAGGVIQEYVAIKVLSPELLGTESQRFQFIQELVALTKFKHSNLIHYIRCGEEEGEVYYAMELCRGGDLVKLVRRFGPIPERVAALVALQVANGLKEVHLRHRLVHRDIKPSNIMLVDELEPGLSLRQLGFRFEEQDSLCRIVDFGLVDFTQNMQEMRRQFVGSPMFASPEQIREQPVDGRADIYSLGMTIWYLVQGRGPLLDARGEDLKDLREVMSRHTDPHEYDDAFPAHLSEGFRELLARMTAKRPEQRFGSAGELIRALEDYLRTAVVETSQPKFVPTRVNGSLDSAYRIVGTLPSRAARRCYSATDSVGRNVRLTLVAGIEGAVDSPEVESLVQKLCETAELTYLPSFPQAILPVNEVIVTADTLAYSEDFPTLVTLADLLRVRAGAKRPLGFNEAYLLLRPLAEALDFLLMNACQSVFLPCEDIWLNARHLGSAPDEFRALSLPLGNWEELRVWFSMMYLPPRPEFGGSAYSPQQTLSGSMQMSEADLHPVPTFARLVYRILNGSEVAAAAQFTPNAYVPAVTLGHVSNNVIRDTLCRTRSWNTVTELLKSICADEGVIWKNEALSAPGRTVTRSTHRGTGSTSVPADRSFPSPEPATRTAIRSSSGPAANRAGQTGSFPAPPAPGEKTCEVLGPGVVCSPYDPERKPQAIAPAQWTPTGPVRCAVTGRTFRLPRKLDPLLARVLGPGLIQSPYAEPGRSQQIAWEDWQPGRETACGETGKKIVLPVDLPLPEGAVPDGITGAVLSPYDSATLVPISPEAWLPGTMVMCPTTLWNFLLPHDLPPLTALADPATPGVLATPYSPAATWTISPPEWSPGAPVVCPITRKPLSIPAEVGEWVADGAIVNPVLRLITNPYRPGTTVEVPPSLWYSGAAVPCPATGRSIRLPGGLPPLTGEIIQPGTVRSPYSREPVALAFSDWVSGREVVCPKTGIVFLLPPNLPDWTPEGSASKPGRVLSPYPPHPEVAVPPAQWRPGERLVCPSTHRPFVLPNVLPLFEGTVKRGEPGWVTSPFSTEPQKVIPAEWNSGQTLSCRATGRQFAMPSDLERWILDGEAIPNEPGFVRSPYGTRPRVQPAPAIYGKPGAEVVCPETGRTFRMPESVPPLLAGLVPGKPGMATTPYDPSRSFPVPPDQWTAGHTLRCPATGCPLRLPPDLPEWIVEASVIPNQAGAVLSPYGRHLRVEVPGTDWFTGARFACPETGRLFALPANLPPMRATPGSTPGLALSPYETGQVVRVPRSKWIPGGLVVCPSTKRNFLLPEALPPWAGGGFPWKIVAPAAAMVLVTVGAVEFWPHPVPPKDDPVKPSPTVTELVPVCELAGIVIEDWPANGAAPALPCFVDPAETSPMGEIATESDGGRFRAKVHLPPAVLKAASPSLHFHLRGWDPVDIPLTPAEKGFVSPPGGEWRLVRTKRALTVQVPPRGVDYNAIVFRWKKPLEGEQTPPVPEKTVSLEGVSSDFKVECPRGVYDVMLTGGGVRRVRQWDENTRTYTNNVVLSGTAGWKVLPRMWLGAKDSGYTFAKDEVQTLPESLEGSYWGLVNKLAGKAVFRIVSVGKACADLEVRQITIDTESKPDGRYLPADALKAPFVWSTRLATMDDPYLDENGELHFQTPFFWIDSGWTLRPKGSGVFQLAWKFLFPNEELEFERMRTRIVATSSTQGFAPPAVQSASEYRNYVETIRNSGAGDNILVYPTSVPLKIIQRGTEWVSQPASSN